MSEIVSTNIPNYLVASSPQGLRRLMLLNNNKRGAWHKYEIQYIQKENRWYAWFYSDPTKDFNDELLKEAASEIVRGKK